MFERDTPGLEGIVGHAFVFAPGFVVEEDASTYNTLLAPGADAVDVFSAFVDVVEGDVVVEFCFLLVGEVA